MTLPFNEISLIISILLVILWAYLKFMKHKLKPNPEDVVDLITLLLLGPVLTIGALFIASGFGMLDLNELNAMRVNLGISGTILIGSSVYIYYVIYHRRIRGR